jgi:hypothetical protein
VEGEWIWDGDGDGEGVQFWAGGVSGEPVNGLYSNWGLEPDNWNNQDGLGLAITNWPLGEAGQWNDVDIANELFYIIEYPTTGIDERTSAPLGSDGPALHPGTPNPFNPSARIEYELPQAASVSLTVRDLLGRRMAVLAEGPRRAGRHAATVDGRGWPSGLYFVTLEAAGRIETRKLLLAR